MNQDPMQPQGGKIAASINDVMMGVVVLLLCAGWTWVWVRQYTLDGHPIIDGNMFKDVLYIVLGYAFGAAGVKKGVEQGTFAALSPPPKNGNGQPTETKP